MQPNPSIQKAAQAVGGQSALANICGVSPQAVSQWMRGLRPVPIERCVLIERATSRIVSRRDLRPDDWADIWPELQEPDHA